MTKVLMWLASGDRSKLMPGILWGVNAKRRGWVDEIRVIVFGDSERTLMNDEVLFNMVQEIEGTLFCRHVAETEGTVGDLEKRGANLAYVGEPIARAIAEGYTVLTF
ncbi:MAG: hypothetical protein M0Z84_14670 [Gammaproteobacteria bacterium]|nr:hypothetical protein [Gammaproteobacteria bacterium]